MKHRPVVSFAHARYIQMAGHSGHSNRPAGTAPASVLGQKTYLASLLRVSIVAGAPDIDAGRRLTRRQESGHVTGHLRNAHVAVASGGRLLGIDDRKNY